MLQLRDTRYNDVRMIFNEEAHSYTDTFGNKYKSVTTILGQYKEDFDRSYWLRKKSKELGISEKRLAKQWDTITQEACARGTKTHNNIEDSIRETSMFKKAVSYLNRNDSDMVTIADIPNINFHIKQLSVPDFIEHTENKYPEIYVVLQYYVNNGYKIYAEIGGFLINYLLSGTIDLLIIRDDQFVIGDWKTNRGGLIFESGYFKKDKSQNPNQMTDVWIPQNKNLLAPVNNLPSCNGSIYQLQVSLYAAMVEIILGIPNKGLWLAHIDSDFVLNEYGQPKRFPDGLYHIKKEPKEKVTIHKMKFLRNEVNLILTDRLREVSASRVTSNTLFD